MQLRLAHASDIHEISELIACSVRQLQAGDYTSAQRECALKTVFTVDSQLIQDGTYFVLQHRSGQLVACGGWSARKTLFGGDHATVRQPELLDPRTHAAKIRAIFVHPAWARMGLGSRMLQACEDAALAAGFSRFEMGSTLTGVSLYTLRGYRALEEILVPLPEGESLRVVRMVKSAC